MGRKSNGKNKKLQVKKTSTPLNANYIENDLPFFENISTVKVLRKWNNIFSTESTQKPKSRSKESVQTILNTAVALKKNLKPRLDSSAVSKRPDTPMNPRKNSQQGSSLALVQKKLRFSRASNSSKQRFEDGSEDICLQHKFQVGVDATNSRRQLKRRTNETSLLVVSSEKQAEFYLNDSTVLVEALMCVEENGKNKIPLTGDCRLSTSLASEKLEGKDLAEHKVEHSFMRKQDSVVNAADISDSIEVCRRDTSGLEVSTAMSSFQLDLLSDEPTDNILKENGYNVLTLERKDVVLPNYTKDVEESGMPESKNDEEMQKFAVNSPSRESCILKKLKKGSNSIVSKNNCYHIEEVALEGGTEDTLIKTIESYNEVKTIETISVVSNGEERSSSNYTCNSKESSCTKQTKETEDQHQDTCKFHKNSTSCLNAIYNKAENMHKKDQVENSRKTKPKISRVSKKKEVKSKNGPSRVKRNKKAAPKETFSFPCTSTPVNTTEISRNDFDLYFEDCSPCNRTRMKNTLGNCILDDLRITEIKASKCYGKLSKTRRKSEASIRWEFLAKKGRRHYVQKKFTENKARNLSNIAEKSIYSLYQTPPLVLLENVPIDEGLRLRTYSEIEKERKSRKNGKKSSRKKLYDSKKFNKLAVHFDEVSKYSLVTELE